MEDRRDSLYFCNAGGKCQHDFQAEVNADKCHKVHESYELKWSGDRNVDEYRKKVAKEKMDIPDALITKDKEIFGRCRKACEEIAVSCRNRKRLKES